MTDDLNRATSIGGVTCTNDLLGNRLTSGSNAYRWDSLNRMTSYNSTTYVYRADGMRTSKSNSTGSTSYRYDGQMGMEDIDYAPGGAVSKITDYGIGARGIDGIYVTQNGSTTANYPIYDAHGNMISTLSHQGTGSYATAALRTFDAWGQIRIGAQTGDPKGRYCASLGHKQDDESGLVYMRARYYEPGSGRFVSEDPGMQGSDWFAYCGNNPVSRLDHSGKDYILDDVGGLLWCLGMLNVGAAGLALEFAGPIARNVAKVMIIAAVICFAACLGGCDNVYGHQLAKLEAVAMDGTFLAITLAIEAGFEEGEEGAGRIAGIALVGVAAWSLAVLGALVANAADDE